MSIASAITAAQGKVADAYTAISNKGGTLPATQNLSNMPTAINSIPTGGGGGSLSREYEITQAGVLQPSTTTATVMDFSGATSVFQYGLVYAYKNNDSITGTVDMSDLVELGAAYACYGTFDRCRYITGVKLDSLTIISGSNACGAMFNGCSRLENIYLQTLTTISGIRGCDGMFAGCDALTSVSLPSLTTVSGNYGCSAMFEGSGLVSASLPLLGVITGSNACATMFRSCVNLTSLSFPAITTTSFGSYTNQFTNMCQDIPNITLHFPSNVQSVIEGLSGYSTTAPFGAMSGTVLFDLPATS